MPLHVEVAINQHRLASLRIARQEHFTGPEKTYPYVVTMEDGRTATFEHLYRDGALVCIQRAIEALRLAGLHVD